MRTLLIAAALAALGASAAAQPAPPIEQIPGSAPAGGRDRHGPGAGNEEHRHGPRLFISPSGEPFRGGDGLAAWFAQADLNHDGAITADEFQADALRVFKSLDTNGDGILDGFEIQAYEQQIPEMGQITFDEGRGRGRRGKKPPEASEDAQPPPAAGRDGAARYSLLNEPEPVLAADADVSGKVTRAEWLQATERRFAKLDRDKTGRLTLPELRAKPPKK